MNVGDERRLPSPRGRRALRHRLVSRRFVPSPAMAVAFIALVCAAGGVAAAVVPGTDARY